jgi:hypothetical protein
MRCAQRRGAGKYCERGRQPPLARPACRRRGPMRPPLVGCAWRAWHCMAPCCRLPETARSLGAPQLGYQHARTILNTASTQPIGKYAASRGLQVRTSVNTSLKSSSGLTGAMPAWPQGVTAGCVRARVSAPVGPAGSAPQQAGRTNSALGLLIQGWRDAGQTGCRSCRRKAQTGMPERTCGCETVGERRPGTVVAAEAAVIQAALQQGYSWAVDALLHLGRAGRPPGARRALSWQPGSAQRPPPPPGSSTKMRGKCHCINPATATGP